MKGLAIILLALWCAYLTIYIEQMERRIVDGVNKIIDRLNPERRGK